MSRKVATSVRLLNVHDRVFVYDAWNRQASLDANGDDDLFDNGDWQYEYDGIGRRISKWQDTANDGNNSAGAGEEFYYNEDYQIVEVRVATTTGGAKTIKSDPRERMLWDLTYVDSPALVEIDSDSNDDSLYTRVVEAFQELIGDCATIKLEKHLTPHVSQRNMQSIAWAKITYEEAESGKNGSCPCNPCWVKLKAMIDSAESYAINPNPLESETKTHHWDPKTRTAYIDEERTFPAVLHDGAGGFRSETPSGKRYLDVRNNTVDKNLVPLSIVLWHELMGHGLTGYPHQGDVVDLAIREENLARWCRTMNGKPTLYRDEDDSLKRQK